MNATLVCDHCGWVGTADSATTHPRNDDELLCPDCWAEGFEATVREQLGPLLEAFREDEPPPRTPKAMCDWTDEEWAMNARILLAKEAHERSDVRLRTNIDGHAQLGFTFMREEFKVKARRGR